MLNRRRMLAGLFAQLGSLPLISRVKAQDFTAGYGTAQLSHTVVDTIVGMSLKELRDFHRRELDNDYLGYWNEHGIDHENGGVMPYREPMVGMPYLAKHPQLKQMYFLGRAIWTFSYIYNHFGHDEKWLDIARGTKDFIYKYGRHADYTWASELTPDGRVLQPHSDIAGDFYVSLGLTEYYKATGDKEALNTALETAYACNRESVDPDFMFYGGWDASHLLEPGTRMLGMWVHLLNTLIAATLTEQLIDLIQHGLTKFFLAFSGADFCIVLLGQQQHQVVTNHGAMQLEGIDNSLISGHNLDICLQQFHGTTLFKVHNKWRIKGLVKRRLDLFHSLFCFAFSTFFVG